MTQNEILRIARDFIRKYTGSETAEILVERTSDSPEWWTAWISFREKDQFMVVGPSRDYVVKNIERYVLTWAPSGTESLEEIALWLESTGR